MDVDKAVVICIPFDILRLCQMCKITFHLNRTMESFNAVIEPRIEHLFYMYLYKQVPGAFWQVIPCNQLTELPTLIVLIKSYSVYVR